MTPQEELAALRRLAELEAKAGGASVPPIPAGRPAIPRGPTTEEPSYDPAAGMSGLQKALVGAGGAARRAYLGVRSLIPGQGLTEDERDELRTFEKYRNNLGWQGTAGDVAANVGMTLIPGSVAAQGITRTATVLPRALAATAPYLAAGGSGALIGAATDPLNRGQAAAYGAVGGVVGQGVGDLAGKAIDGVVKMAPAAKRLPQKVRDAASLGQLVDRDTVTGKVVGNLEEAGRSIPVVGSRITRVREQGLDAWRNNLIDDVSPQGFSAAPGDGSDRLAEVYREFKRRYGSALANQQISPSQNFEATVLRIVNDPKRGLTPQQAEQVKNTVMGAYQARFAPVNFNVPPGTAVATGPRPPTVTMSGDSAKEFESFLSNFARRFEKGTAPTDGIIGQLYDDIERAWSAEYRRQMGSSARRALAPLDSQYAKYKTVENAAGSAGNTAGNFTPAQLNLSVKTRTGQGRFGRGEGLLNREAQDAKELFMDHLPNSGTVDRAVAINAGAVLAALADPVTAGTALATLGATTTKTGKNLMLGQTAAQRLAQRLRLDDFSRYAGPRVGIAFGMGEGEEEE